MIMSTTHGNIAPHSKWSCPPLTATSPAPHSKWSCPPLTATFVVLCHLLVSLKASSLSKHPTLVVLCCVCFTLLTHQCWSEAVPKTQPNNLTGVDVLLTSTALIVSSTGTFIWILPLTSLACNASFRDPHLRENIFQVRNLFSMVAPQSEREWMLCHTTSIPACNVVIGCRVSLTCVLPAQCSKITPMLRPWSKFDGDTMVCDDTVATTM